jgi:hypothetical protein
MRYDRQVAAALGEALEGNVANAATILQQVSDDIVTERKSRARFLYLVCADAVAAATASVAGIVTRGWFESLIGPYNLYAHSLWLAVTTGALGAFFSISRGISDRSIRTDLQMLDNMIDAVVRVIIGAIAALVLAALLNSGLFAIDIAAQKLGGDGKSPMPMLYTVIAGFLAGFSERLVPDLLSSATIKPTETPEPKPNPAKDGAKADGVPSLPPPPAPGAVDDATDGAPDPDEAVDGCDVDLATAGVPDTPDDRLPAASGGVAAAQ